MKRSRGLLLVLIACLVAAWLTHRHCQQVIATAQQAAARAAADRAALIARSRSERPRPEASARPAATSPRSSAAAKAAGTQVKHPVAPDSTTLTANDPQLRDWTLQGDWLGKLERFGSLMDRLELTDEQRQALKRITQAQLEAQFDLLSAADSQGLSRNDPALLPQWAALRDQAERDERAALGPSFDGWLQGVKQVRSIQISRELMQMTFATDGSYTPEQEDQITQILSRHQTPMTATRDQSGFDWAGVMADAPGVLNAQQLAAFRTAAAALSAESELSAMVRAAQK